MDIPPCSSAMMLGRIHGTGACTRCPSPAGAQAPRFKAGLGSIVRERALAPGSCARQSGRCLHSRKEAPMTATPRWKRRPPGSTWGDFGSDDQRGRLNLLTPKKVLQGVAEVK